MYSNLALFNARYGPRQTGENHALFIETADELAKNMSPNSKALRHFYPRILAADGRPQSDDTEEPGTIKLHQKVRHESDTPDSLFEALRAVPHLSLV